MDKEKEIEEMADICYANRDEWSYHEQGFCYAQAKALYNADYRKADEVRKETAKEILQKLYNLTYYARPTICEIAKEYNVKFEVN